MWITEITKVQIIKSMFLAASLGILSGCGEITEPLPLDETTTDNIKPIAEISPSAEQSIFVGESLTFTGDGSSDPDSNTPLTYKWFITLDGAPDSVQLFTEENPAPFVFDEVGVATVGLVVTDSLGLSSDPAYVTVVVNEVGINRAPNGEISYSIGSGAQSTGNFSVIAGTDVVFTGTATDPDNDPVTIYDWTIPSGVSVTGTPSDAPFTANFPSAGTYLIALTVTDDKGSVDLSPAEVTVTVTNPQVNQQPVAVISPANNQTVTVGESINFSGAGSSDPDGNIPLTYAWIFETIPTTGIRTTQTFNVANPGAINFPVAGTVKVSLVVTDNASLASNPATVVITVNDAPANLPPVAVISPANNQTVTVGDSINFTGDTSSDPDGNTPLTYAWTFETTPTTGMRTRQIFNVANPGAINFPVAGTVKVSLVVTDSLSLASDPATVVITVNDTTANLPPIAKISPANNQTVAVGDSINFTGDTSSDPDGNTPLTYAWTFVTTPTTGMRTTQTFNVANPGSISFPVAGTVQVSLVVTDSLSLASDPATVVITVNDATVNQQPIARMSPEMSQTITVGDTITFADNNSSDPDNNNPLTYLWTFSGSNTSIPDSTLQNPGSIAFNQVDTVTVRLVVTDSLGLASDPASITVTVTQTAVTLPAFKALPLLTPTIVNGVSTYNLVAKENVLVTVDSPEGSWQTPMMRYNDFQLPPVIVAKRGDSIKVNVNNTLSEDTTVHWHGFKIPGKEDGGPDIAFGPGTSKTYTFDLLQPAAPLWFHPHADGFTATQVYKGLAGAFIITDDITDSLEGNNQLPAGDHDVALLVQDRSFDTDNGNGIRELLYVPNSRAGLLGDRVLVNGVESPVLEVDTRQYRLRLYNGSNARTYNFSFDNNADFYVVATDGGLLNIPVLTKNIVLSAGERVEIVVDFGGLLNQQVMLVSSGGSGGMMGGGSAFNIMRFDVNTTATDPVTLYNSLAELTLPSTPEILTRLTADQVTGSTRTFNMALVNGQYLINGKVFDLERVDEAVTLGSQGTTEIWEISNDGMMPMAHPFHAHAIQWQILDRGPTGGQLSPATGVDLGWKDTVLVQPGETVRFIGHFDPVINSGLYMYHCHILEHEDNGMMGTFEVK